MTRIIQVSIGTDIPPSNQQLQIDDSVYPPLGSPESWTVDITHGPVIYTRDLVDPMALSENVQVAEQNAFTLTKNDTMALSHPPPTVAVTHVGSQPIIVGTSMQDSSFSSTAAKWNFYRGMFGKIPCFRSFTPTGQGIKKWNTDGDLQQVLNTPSCRRVIQSLKGSGTDPQTGKAMWEQSDLDAWWSQSNFPAENSGIEIYLSWWHEPNGDWDGAANTARYRQIWKDLCDFKDANAPNNVHTAGPVWASGNIIYDGNGAFQDWHPGRRPNGEPYLDFNAIDLYSRPFRSNSKDIAAGHQGYLVLEDLFDNTTIGNGPHSFWDALDAGQLPCKTGRWIVEEVASTNVRDPTVSGTFNPADADDSRRGLFARNMYTRMSQLRNDCEALTWWAATDQGNYEYWTWAGTQANPLADPLAVAWRQNCQDSAAALGW